MMREALPDREDWTIGALRRVIGYLRRLGHLMPRRGNYPLLGALLAVGMAFGLLVVRSVASGVLPTWSWILDELATQPLTYAYVTFSTLILLVVLGYLLGRKSDRLFALSNTDPLTGLYNRRHFTERLELEMIRSARYQVPLSLMSVDLDHLKGINDKLGHQIGDSALVAVAVSLLGSVRGIDIAARVGGDEFAVLFPQTTAADAEKQAARFVKSFGYQSHASAGPLSVSVGVAEFDPKGGARTRRGEEFLLAADTALYQAKAAGGGCTILAKANLPARNALSATPRRPLRILEGAAGIST